MKFKALFASLLLVGIVLSSCKEEVEEASSIPNCDVLIETNATDYVTLKIVNNYVTYVRSATALMPTNFELGYGGILIYRDQDDKIQGCDLACPVEASRSVLVDVKMPFATCPQCGSRFDLTFGFAAPCGGPAKETLKRYKAIDTGNKIVVSN
ncbi:MAG TPA: hypothetical protein PLN63_07865 [Paludibacteraceae bacterium]|nr:hypothetical protein [Paludibacteraceae bacterium]HOU69526.1 hypothetical protein [Paludibacteraceae bacterium]HPH63517.1 hypothetical protein [Paludibacteraceae bacterium]HQF51211.1 hypothetical protein [Paludibacteraceae bacterium]HQJ91256.1 hypothetical protein [Paludibacteraceae bacterium]